MIRIGVSTALAVTLSAAVAMAQSTPDVASSPRLTVRPHEMTLGTRTAKAGLTELAGFSGYYLYVPKQCVGTMRCPFILLLHGGGRSGSMEIHKFSSLADKYGMIVLAGNAIQPGRWDVIAGWRNGETQKSSAESGIAVTSFHDPDVRRLDSALTRVFSTNAIDPDRIALVGFSDGGSYSLFLGRSNQDIFSRVAALSALIPFAGSGGPVVPKTQFFLSGGIAEGMVKQTLKMSQVLRHEGHPVATLLGLRGHVDRVEDEDFIWAWLKNSWADPSITTRGPVQTDSTLLTLGALQRMTDFWTRFQKEPDSIRTTGRLARQERMPLSLGAQRVSVITMDIQAMAKAYPSVAADLKAAGLSAKQEEAYRRAILRVGFARMGDLAPGDHPRHMELGADLPPAPIDPASVLGKNLAFRMAHDAEFQALSKTQMWVTQ